MICFTVLPCGNVDEVSQLRPGAARAASKGGSPKVDPSLDLDRMVVEHG